MDRKLEASLLLTLEEISQLISHSHNPQETLANVVSLLQRRFGTEVCSVYLLEPRSRELVLADTVGLQRSAIGRIRMRLDEGLVGLTAQQARPVVVPDAFQHPRFKYFPEAGEDPYHSFLGVPLLEAGQVSGVLVLQTTQARDYAADEVRMLITAASQLSPLLGEAWLLKQVEGPDSASGATGVEGRERVLSGSTLSPGMGCGAAYWVRKMDWHMLATAGGNAAHERQRLTEALDLARQETERLSQRIAAIVGEDQAAITQAQLLILQDSKVQADFAGFLAGGASAEAAVLKTSEKYSRAFEKISSPYFRERIYDINEVFRRVLWHLRPVSSAPESESGRLVLVADEASVSDLFSVDPDRLAAVVVERGGRTGHAAILARTLKIPMVGMVSNLTAAVATGTRLLVDADQSLVYVEPSPQRLQATRFSASGRPATDAVWPAVAAPEAPATVARLPLVEANINLVSEVRMAVAQDAAGVGLYRTEFLVLSQRMMVSEEQQVRNYRLLLSQLGGRPANIRTFDLRADKSLPPSSEQPDPASLDWRLVLRSPAMQRVFRQQVRAILRAGSFGPVRILVPMVFSSQQLQWVKATVREAWEELQAEGLPCASAAPLGIMIEVPLAASMVGEWAPDVDFLCVGTNDLLASALGIARDDPVSEIVCDPLHPGLVRIVEQVITAGHAAGKSVTICGELAASELGVQLLANLGADALSVAVEHIGRVRQWLRERA